MANVRISGITATVTISSHEGAVVASQQYTDWWVSWTGPDGPVEKPVAAGWSAALAYVVDNWPTMPDWHPDGCVCGACWKARGWVEGGAVVEAESFLDTFGLRGEDR